MVVMILEKVPASLRGELTRWLFEAKTGVFIGKVSAIVRDKLWDLCVGRRGTPAVIQIWNDNNEQGFSLRSNGDTSRNFQEKEGLWFAVKHLPKEDAVATDT